MRSHSGRFRLVFNGEIYNYRAMRSELDSSAAPSWHGTSDTEVLLAGIEAWGVATTLKKADGMFAFALWDEQERTLLVARDRMGEKPLYFGWVGGCFAFSSELKGLACVPGWSPNLSPRALMGYMESGYVRGPQSAVEGVFRLPQGCMLTIREGEFFTPVHWEVLSGRLVRYWSLAHEAIAGQEARYAGSLTESADILETLLRDAVRSRMVSDVPVGAFLSGGIDSSLVVALMRDLSFGRVRTFSIGFAESAFDEAPFARDVASFLGTEHTELYATPADALAVIPELHSVFDEPFADQSQIPTILLSRLTRQHVTVALSGDAGDELFAGYGRYAAIPKLWTIAEACPIQLRRPLASWVERACRSSGATQTLGKDIAFRMERLAHRLGRESLEELRIAYIGGLGAASPSPMEWPHCIAPQLAQPVRRLMFCDQVDYLPDNILVKLDRASMAASLESRVPFLAPEVVRFSWQLHADQLRSGHHGKLVLREVLARHVPRQLWDRPKQGFSPPISGWLRRELRDWAESLLTPGSLADLPILHAATIRTQWQRHQAGSADFGHALWNTLMLLSWSQNLRGGR